MVENPDQIRVGFSFIGKSRRDLCWIFPWWKIQTRFVLDFPSLENPDQIRVGFSLDGKSRRDPCWIFLLDFSSTFNIRWFRGVKNTRWVVRVQKMAKAISFETTNGKSRPDSCWIFPWWKIQTRFVLDFPAMENADEIRVGFSIKDGKSRPDSCWIFRPANLLSWLMKTLTILHLAHLVALQNVEDMDHCHKHVQSRFQQWMAAHICLQNLHPHLFALWINAHPLQ